MASKACNFLVLQKRIIPKKTLFKTILNLMIVKTTYNNNISLILRAIQTLSLLWIIVCKIRLLNKAQDKF